MSHIQRPEINHLLFDCDECIHVLSSVFVVQLIDLFDWRHGCSKF